jgi:hypothetical protein
MLQKETQQPLWHIIGAVIVGLKRKKSPRSCLRGDPWSVRLALPAMLTATLPISVALLATATIRLLLLLPGLMLSAALLSTALLSALALTALPTLLATLVLLALIVLVHVFLLLCHREINASIGPPFLKVPLMQLLCA